MTDQTETARAADAYSQFMYFTAEAHRRKWSYYQGLDGDGQPIKSEAFDALHRLGSDMLAALNKLDAARRAVAVPAPAAELRRMAVEAQQQPCRNCRGSGLDPRYNGEYVCPDCPVGVDAQAACPDPIECGHEAALGQARETNRRLNLRAQKLESELATYRRAVGQWEVSKRGTYVPLRTIAAIAKAAGRDIETPQWLLHYQRVEQAEAAIEQLRTENARMRHELEVMYGGAFDSAKGLPAVVAAAAGEARAPRSDVGTEFVHQTDHPDEAGLAAFEADLASKASPKADSKAASEAQPVQHAPGIAILCADCDAKGYAVCMDAAVSQPGKEN